MISRALHLFLTVALASFYWMILWRPCARKKMQSTKHFTLYVQAYFYSKMKQMPFNLPHIQPSDNLRKTVCSESNQKKGLFLMISQCNQLSPLSAHCAALFFNFLWFFFFSLTISLTQGVNGQVFAFSWENALTSMPLYAIVGLKLLISEPRKVWLFWSLFFPFLQSPTIFKGNWGSLRKVLYTSTHNWGTIRSLILHEPSHNNVSGKGLTPSLNLFTKF